MNNPMKMLAIDLGASSGRGIIGNFDGEKFSLSENHRFPNEPVMISGGFCWDILRIFHEIKNSIRKCTLYGNSDIASIGIDTWGVDYGLLDKNGRLLANPMHYRDARNAPAMNKAFSVMSREELYKITGIQFMDFNTVYQLYADMLANPELLELASDMLFTPDLLDYFLTGTRKTEYTIASTAQLLGAGERNWSNEIINRFNLPKHLFSGIEAPGSNCGKLTREVLEDVGTAINADVIKVASHDTASAVVSVPTSKEKFLFISSGTWSIMGTETAEPVINETAAKYDFTNEGGAEGTIRLCKNITGLWLEQESRRQWKREGEEVSFNELSEMAMAAKPLRSIINPDAPIFSAPGNLPARIADYCRNTNQPIPESKGEIVRCIFDSIALRYKWTAESIDNLLGEKIPVINIVGGGTKEEPLSRLAASACGRLVRTGPVEATALGNIAIQAIAKGELKDIRQAREAIAASVEIKEYEPQNTEMWDEAYEKFKSLI